MNNVAREALAKLLRSAENARGKGGVDRTISLLFSSASFPDYFGIKTRIEKDACHGELQLAELAGAIHIDWERQAGEHGQIERIVLEDAVQLAKHLGVTPRWDAVRKARLDLGEWLSLHPVLEDVLASWSVGRKPRGTSPSNVTEWVDSARVLAYIRNSDELDIPVRRISTKLTCDSKRVESLWDIIDVLLQGDLCTPVRNAEEVFGEIGLIKYPPTLLLSGDVRVSLPYTDGKKATRLPVPYLGFSPGCINGFDIDARPVTLMSVENLTTFHELCALCNAVPGRILIYTGGMPSPSWKRVYRMLLEALPDSSTVYHWGDIDAGGFRIAGHLAEACAGAGLPLRLFMMVLDKTATDGEQHIERKELNDAELRSIEAISMRWGWSDEREWVLHTKRAIEQESLPVMWPV